MNSRLAHFGRVLFGVGLAAFGTLHFIYGEFVTRVVPAWPAWLPQRMLWVAVLGGILLLAGASAITGIKTRPAMAVLAAVLALSIGLLHLPGLAADVVLGGAWTSTGKALVLLAGCLVVATSLYPRVNDPSGTSAAAARHRANMFGRVCLAAFLILAGAQHFRWVGFVATLVPAWVPGGGVLWTYVSAVLLLAGGFGLLIPSTARLAALGSGAMIFSWVFLVHLPRVIQGVGSRPNEATALFEALAFSGLALLIAGSSARAVERAGIPD